MTTLLYLENTYQFEADAIITDIEINEFGTALILDQTIFYPQGGGQTFDTGTISVGENTFTVDNVRLSPEGIVYHYGQFESEPTQTKGQTAQLNINSERRLLNARIHSAGHLIDIAVSKANIQGLTPSKGFHTPEGAYVEFEGMLEEPTSYIEALEAAANQIVQSDIKIISKNLSPEAAKAQGVYAPEGKSARFVYFEGYEDLGCGCGGTHVATTTDIGPITIRKIKSKKGVTRISYAVA